MKNVLTAYLFGLLVIFDERGDIFLGNIGRLSAHNTVLYPKR